MKYNTGLVIVVLLVALPLFAHLDQLPINLYDEARLADNAIEMSRNHQWLVPTYLGQPEMWNTKPPLMIWFQVLSLKIIGTCELAIRIPSALAALATLLIMYRFCAKRLKRPILGILCCTIMATSMGFVGEHMARTGDYDALLTFFVTGYLLSYFVFIDEDKREYLLYTLLLITGAVMTKGIAGLLPMPALLVYMLYRKKFRSVFTTPTFYMGITFFIVIVTGYYLLREHYNPGYLKAVYNNELGGRYSEINENHEAPWYFYLVNLAIDRFNFWWYLVPIGLVIGLYSEAKSIKNFCVFCLVVIVCYYAVLSSSATKLWWYDMPVYPWLAIGAALGIYLICELLFCQINKRLGATLITTVTLLIIIYPYNIVIRFALSPRMDYSGNSSMVRYVQEVSRHKRRMLGSAVPLIDQNVLWYMEAFHLDIESTPVAELKIGQKPMIYDDGNRQYLDQHFTYEILEQYEQMTVYKITGTK